MASDRKDVDEYERVIMITGGAGFMYVSSVLLLWSWLARVDDVYVVMAPVLHTSCDCS
jgi:hypothetical protein